MSDKRHLDQSPLADLFAEKPTAQDPEPAAAPAVKTTKATTDKIRKKDKDSKTDKKPKIQENRKYHNLSGPKERFTVNISGDLVERLRNAVFWTPGVTLSDITEEALTKALRQLEKDRGEPFPQRKGGLRGRPVR